MDYMEYTQECSQPIFLLLDQAIIAVPLSKVSSSMTLLMPEFVHFSASTIARTRKTKADFEVRMTAMRLYQQDGKQWNPLQCLRDREVRRLSGEQLDTHILEGRTRESSKAGSVSSFAATDSLPESRTSRGRKRHSSPVQPPQRGHTRQQSSRHHAERYRMLPRGLENWSITSEEYLSNYAWQQSNPHRMVNRHYQLINPPTDDERRSDGVASKSSSFEYARARYSSETVPLSPQISLGSPLGRTTSAKTRLRNVPSFAMSSTSVNRSRSPSPVRSTAKHTRQTSDLLDIPQRVKKKIQDRIKGDRSGVSSRAHSPGRSDTVPTYSNVQEDIDTSKPPRAGTMPHNLRLDIDVLTRRPTISRRPKPTIATYATESKRELARTRARLISTGITTRAMLPSEDPTSSVQPIKSCQNLMNKFHDLDRSLTTSFEHDFPQATSNLLSVLTPLESRQAQISNQVSSSLTKTRSDTAVKIAEIASEQTSTLLLQLKAVEDKMDALEYRTNSGWTHEKTLHLVFWILEYIVMIVLWHLWVFISVLRYGKRFLFGVWGVFWGLVVGIIGLIRWMFFL